MKKKILAIILEIIPVVSAIAAVSLVASPLDSPVIRKVISAAFLLAFLGFAFFLLGRRLAGKDKAVQILGILACAATVFMIGYYILAIICFGL